MDAAPASTMLLEGLGDSDHAEGADRHELQASVQHDQSALSSSPEWHYPVQDDHANVPAHQKHGLHHRRCGCEGAS